MRRDRARQWRGGGIGLGEGLAGQLLAYKAQTPVLNELLRRAGFKGADPVSALVGAAAPGGEASGSGGPASAADGSLPSGG